MTKQHNTQTSVLLERDGTLYLVTLEGLKNDPNGARRFKAYVTDLADAERSAADGSAHGTGAFVYTFKGHYDTEKGEAEFILSHHLAKANG